MDLLELAAAKWPDREALVDRSCRLTFKGLAAAAAGVAGGLSGVGMGTGDVLALVLPSGADYAVCYHAAMRLGAVTSGVNPRLGPKETGGILARTRPVVTVAPAGWRPPPGAPAGKVLAPADVREWWTAGAGPRPAVAPFTPVAVVWTSGTTGPPKGAVYDHANLAAVARGAGDLSRPGDRRLSPLPFAHVGFMTKAWDELANGITTVVTPTPWKAGEAIAVMEREKVTVAQGVPTQWRLLLDHPALRAADLSSLRVVGTGASAVPPALVRELCERLGCPVVVGYASTETAIITRSRIGDSDEDVARTVGRPSEGVEVSLVDDDGEPVPPGSVGHVRCRSAAAMRGRWPEEGCAFKSRAEDEWVDTGDLGRLDERGFLTLAGRSGDMYVRGGYNVYPAEVEGLLAEHPLIAQAAVVARRDPVLGEVGVAFVVPASRGDGRSLDTAGIRDWCRERLADYKAPEAVILVEALPLTAMSKVDKALLAERAGEVEIRR